MPWLKVGDTAANHPIVVAALEDEHCDDRLLNELFGFALRCALQSTAHLTDYVITRGTAKQIAGLDRAEHLIAAALAAGYMEAVTVEGRTGYRLHQDPEFIHMRTREEIEWERERKNDTGNPALVIPVRHRDGDACRYCGQVVRWNDRKGRSAGTYDHLTPGQRATSPDDVVVACRRCNAALKDTPRSVHEQALLPAPTRPYYLPNTLEYLRGHAVTRELGLRLPSEPEGNVKAGTVPPGRPVGTVPTATALSTDGSQPSESSSPAGPQGPTTVADPAAGAHAPPTVDSQSTSQADTTAGPQGPTTVADPAAVTTPASSQYPSWALDDREEASGPQGPTTVADPADAHEEAPEGDLPRSAGNGGSRQIPPDRLTTGSGYSGTGRDGAVRVGPERYGEARAGSVRKPRSPGLSDPVPAGGRSKRRRRR